MSAIAIVAAVVLPGDHFGLHADLLAILLDVGGDENQRKIRLPVVLLQVGLGKPKRPAKSDSALP